jgi:hypothetical protein
MDNNNLYISILDMCDDMICGACPWHVSLSLHGAPCKKKKNTVHVGYKQLA